MTAAHPLDFDDSEVRPLTDEDLAQLPPDVRERARWSTAAR